MEFLSLKNEFPKSYFPEIETSIEEIEELPPREEADKTEEPLEEMPQKLFIGKATKDEKWFRAFIDGSYRLARVGYFRGIPIYIASITAVLTSRDERKRLKEIGMNKHLTVIFFPFDAMEKVLKTDEAKKLKLYFEKKYKSLPDYKFRGDTLQILKKHGKNIWVYSDITYRGFQYDDTHHRKIEIDENNLFDEGKIFVRAKTKTRVLMTMMEVAN
ncbi:MAG: hypothetical protein J7L39_04105, partial [Candidatus Aenigmarchaeota archaeon]|nr:hypothetical protein [Candidatus Aenigmarchaeota archaeon]